MNTPPPHPDLRRPGTGASPDASPDASPEAGDPGPATLPSAMPDDLVQALRSLSQDVRLSLLVELSRRGPICVTELSATQTREACTVSRHLTNMTAAGLVRFRQQGQQRFYSLDRERVQSLLGELGDLLGL